MKKAHIVRFFLIQVIAVSAKNKLGHIGRQATMGDDNAADICHDEVAGVGSGSGGRGVVTDPHTRHVEAPNGGADIEQSLVGASAVVGKLSPEIINSAQSSLDLRKHFVMLARRGSRSALSCLARIVT